MQRLREPAVIACSTAALLAPRRWLLSSKNRPFESASLEVANLVSNWFAEALRREARAQHCQLAKDEFPNLASKTVGRSGGRGGGRCRW